METIKEEKKADLEQLLNMLIQRGWKPFGEGCHRSPYKRVSIHKNYNKERTYVLFYSDNHTHWKVLRQVVSKESGLWQFVCEKGYEIALEGEKPYIERDYIFDSEYYDISDYQYWLMVGALLGEDKLEDFLLNSIKLD